jgi:hypothetical protein
MVFVFLFSLVVELTRNGIVVIHREHFLGFGLRFRRHLAMSHWGSSISIDQDSLDVAW